MKHFLDTNIYRNLVRDLSMDEVKLLASEIRKGEKALGISAGFPIVVAMELINHLRSTDKECDECYKALCLLFDHSKNYDAEKDIFSGAFFPPLNIVLPKFFFNENGPFLEAYKVIIALTKDLTENYDIKNIKKYITQINAVSDQLMFEKQELYDNLIAHLTELNGGILDWQFFQKNKHSRDKWFREMATGKAFVFLAEGFMMRAYMLTDRTFERTNENFVQFKEFHDTFFPAIAMSSILLIQVGHGTNAISDIRDPRWNTVLDISMMFGALYNSKLKEITFVTEEKKMHEFFKINGMQDQIINLVEFKRRLGL